MEKLCPDEKREHPAGLVLPHTRLAWMLTTEAAQLRLALRLRGGPGGNVVPFNRMHHAASAGEVKG
jgi:hypothetical protein